MSPKIIKSCLKKKLPVPGESLNDIAEQLNLTERCFKINFKMKKEKQTPSITQLKPRSSRENNILSVGGLHRISLDWS